MLIRNIYFKILKKVQLFYSARSFIHKDSTVESGSEFVNSYMNRHSYIGYKCTILNTHIGSFCSIANNVTIGGISHPMHFVSTSPVFLSHKDSVKKKFAHHNYLPMIETVIENDVWIGEGVHVKAGVTIATGAVIGMGSVVTKSIPSYAIYAGNPAKLIRYRFDEITIQELLDCQWWTWTDEKLKSYGKYFNDPQKFIDTVQKGNI